MYPVPFDDLDVPVEMKEWLGEVNPLADWNDDAVYGKILTALNQRQMRGDVPLNLTATSLVVNSLPVYRRGSLSPVVSRLFRSLG